MPVRGIHLLLTDRATCPRCGPEFGLILIAHRMESRRIEEGALGCANCRERYPISGGVADLRPPPRIDGTAEAPWTERGGSPPEGAQEVMRIAALLGITEGPAFVAFTSSFSEVAPLYGTMVPEGEAVLLHEGASPPRLPEDLRGADEALPAGSGTSHLRVGDALPFRSGSIQGFVSDGERWRSLLPEAVRTLAPGGRLVIIGGDEEARRDVMSAGLGILLASFETTAEGIIAAVRR